MPSLFESISKNLVKELGDRDLRPVRFLLNANKYCQLALLRKRKSRSWFWEQPDVPVEYTLVDILEPSSSVPETVVTGPFLLSDTRIQKLKAYAGVAVGPELSASGEAAQSHESSLEFQSVTIPPHNWEALQKRKVLNQKLSFLKEHLSRRDNLYVVTEAMELTSSTTLPDRSCVKVKGTCLIPWSTCVKSEGEGEGLKVRGKTLTLLQGTVMAYKRKQLVFKENGWDFQHLQEEVSQEMTALAQLSKDIRGAVFHRLLAKLRDRGALQDLVDMVRSILEPNFRYPESIAFTLKPELLAPLQGEGVAITFGLLEGCGLMVEPISHTATWDPEAKKPLSALYGAHEERHGGRRPLVALTPPLSAVLSDTQRCLLALCLGRGVLPQQLELVASILGPNFNQMEETTFSLPWPSSPPCRVRIWSSPRACGELRAAAAGAGYQLTWDPDVVPQLSALYVTLAGLQPLADPSPGARQADA
ncbi:hypothetical protein CB1_001179043 [Camelus ferus]|nr:hypothetical protein CB1_001179043 [Camelus ferus]